MQIVSIKLFDIHVVNSHHPICQTCTQIKDQSLEPSSVAPLDFLWRAMPFLFDQTYAPHGLGCFEVDGCTWRYLGHPRPHLSCKEHTSGHRPVQKTPKSNKWTHQSKNNNNTRANTGAKIMLQKMKKRTIYIEIQPSYPESHARNINNRSSGWRIFACSSRVACENGQVLIELQRMVRNEKPTVRSRIGLRLSVFPNKTCTSGGKRLLTFRGLAIAWRIVMTSSTPGSSTDSFKRSSNWSMVNLTTCRNDSGFCRKLKCTWDWMLGT